MTLRRVACILAFASVLPSAASAQPRRPPQGSPPPAAEAAPPAPAGPEAAAEAPVATPEPYGPAAPASPAPTGDEGAAIESTSEPSPPSEPAPPPRDGAFVNGGLWLTAGDSDTRSFLRVEAGLPLSSHLSLMLPVVYGPDRVDVPGYFSQRHTLLMIPGLRNDWTLYSGKSAFTAYAEGGAGAGVVRSRTDEFGGQVDETTWLGVARVGGGVSFVTPFGLSATLQPLGLAVFFDDTGARARYDFSIMVGYRGR